MEALSNLAVEKTAERFSSAIDASLAEARISATNERYLEEISALPGAGPRPFIRWIANEIDPTKNGIYSTWLIRRWLAGDFRFLEDLFKARSALESFDKVKPRLPVEQRDINKYKSFGALDALVDTLAPTSLISNKEQERAIERDLIASGQAEISHDDADIKIIMPRTEAASCYFGRNTKWCTAAKSNNQFKYYSSSGDLYIILFKKENKRWQFSFETDQFMNEFDKSLQLDDIKPIIGKYFRNLDWISIVKKNGFSIQYLTDPSEELQLATVKQAGYAIQYIKNPSEEVQLAAVRQDGYAIRYIENPSEEAKLAAVKQDGYAIRYIKNPSEEMKLAAVKQNDIAIQFIENPSEEVKLAAVRQDGYAIRYIENPSEEAKLAAVKQDGYAIQHIENPSEEVKLAAVKQDGCAILYIKNPSEEVKRVLSIIQTHIGIAPSCSSMKSSSSIPSFM